MIFSSRSRTVVGRTGLVAFFPSLIINIQMNKNILKISEEPGELTIQTEQIAFQAIFNSTILQFTNYNEQLQKYKYRAALSGVNLRVQEFDRHYMTAKKEIEDQYSQMVYRSVSMIHDLLLSVRFAKAEMWNGLASVTWQLKNQAYRKAHDPYQFNVKQFDHDFKRATDTLTLKKQMVAEGREIIEMISSKLKKVEAQKMDEMFSGKVFMPYVAESRGVEVDPSKVYNSYLYNIRMKCINSDETLIKKHFLIHDEIHNFTQYIYNHSYKMEEVAIALIKQYNESPMEEYAKVNINKVISLVGRKQKWDAEELFSGKVARMENKSCLTNKISHVQFLPTLRVLDLTTNQEQLVEYLDADTRPGRPERIEKKFMEQSDKFPDKQFFQMAERRRIVKENYPTEHYQEIERRMLEEERKIYKKKEEKPSARKIIRTMVNPAPWERFCDAVNPFLFFYSLRSELSTRVWNKNHRRASDKEKDIDENAYKHPKIEAKAGQLSPQALNQLREEANRYESKRRREEQVRLSKLQHLMSKKPYEVFLKISKIEAIQKAYCYRDVVSRFGITIKVDLDTKDLKQCDKFLYYYFKERYYRESEGIEENSDNPIIFVDPLKINLNGTPKVVGSYISSLVKRVNSFPFFLVWGEDIIHYRKEESKEGPVASFQMYSYSPVINAQKILYEMRRRVELPVKETIIDTYFTLTQVDQIYSKIENVHRCIYQRHKRTPSSETSVQKGRQLWGQIIEDLRKRS